jgi:hypothetical protein
MMLKTSKFDTCIAQPGGFNILSFSDVHLGHPNTTAEHIVGALDALMPDNSSFGEIDIIFINGDLLDRVQSMADDAVVYIIGWMCRFMIQCQKWDVVVRVLEGTPSHDWRQSRLMPYLNEIAAIGCDIRFVQTLSIEYIERFGMQVLYIPDEWNPSCDATWLQVTELLKTHNLDKVDIISMHGAFPYQMPQNVRHLMELHNPERYLSIVNHWVLIGHIHRFSQYEKILAAGSTDRLAHGEEDKKGMIYIRMRPSGSDVKFIPNRRAKAYVTVDCTDLNAEESLDKVDRLVRRLEKDSHVRIRGKRSDPVYSGLDTLKQKYPYFHWTVKETGTRKDVESPIGLTDRRLIGSMPSLTRENMADQLMARVIAKHPLNATVAAQLLEELMREGTR